MAYFYLNAYLAVRKWNRTRLLPVNVVVKGKLDRKLAYTTFWLAVFFAVSGLPSLVVHLFRGVLPFFRQVSTMRWTETIFLLNSLFNPLLYWYRNRRLRKATLELLSCRNRPAARNARHIRQRAYSVASLDVAEKLPGEKNGARVLKSESLGAMMCLDTLWQGRKETVKERPMSAPSRVANDELSTQQRSQLIVTAQIEKAPGRKTVQQKIELPKTTTELGSVLGVRSVVVRSNSLNENSFLPLTKSDQNLTQRNTRRSRSGPMILTNLNEPKDRTTVDELTNKESLSYNR